MIFSNFEPKAICTRLAPICRRWRRLAYTKSVWRHKQIQFDIDADHPERMKSLAALLKKVRCCQFDFEYLIEYFYFIYIECGAASSSLLSYGPIKGNNENDL